MSAGNGRMDVEGLVISNQFCTSLERGNPGGDYPGAVRVPGGGQENDADQHCVGGVSLMWCCRGGQSEEILDVPDRFIRQAIRRSML